LEEFQNKSIGKTILKYLINYIEINKISEVQLSVDIQNSIAIYLYHKYNFKISEIVKIFISINPTSIFKLVHIINEC
jgi:ribosomal protein S18 acetylase RimI-like enzyme